MPGFFKKIMWPYYAVTFLIFTLVFLWGITGVFWGGGAGYQGVSFKALLPGAALLGAVILGIKNAHAKCIYPIFCGMLAGVIFHLVFGEPIFSRAAAASFFLPLLSALIGLGLGVLIRTSRRMRQIARGIVILGVLIALVHVGHAATLDRIIKYTEVSFSAPNLPPEMDGYRIAFITDTHEISRERLNAVVDELNRRGVDLLLLGGDFARSAARVRQTVEILAQVQAADGIFGVEGNHDDYVFLFALMEANGMVPLSNSGLHIRENFFLAGVEDYWNRSPNIALALQEAQPDDFVLLVSHNPDISMRQDTSAVCLILSGHTHGGQIAFFGIWAPYFTITRHLTAYGQRFRSGWAQSRDGTPVFVSRGTGEYMPRVFARPEVILMTLHSHAP